MINVSKYTIHDSILSNFQFMCCLFSSSPKKLPQKNKSKHHHHHKIIQIKHKIQNLQNIQNQKTERTQPWKEALQIRFENTMPFEAIGSWISYSLVKSQEAFLGEKKPAVAEFPGEKTWCQPYSRWWFQRFFIFTTTWGNDPNWLIFFKWVETTN